MRSSGIPARFENRFPVARRQDGRRYPGLPLLGGILSRRRRMGPGRRFRGLEESCQARLLLRCARHQSSFLHLRPRHSPLVRSEGRSPELFYLSLCGDKWPAGKKSADTLFVSRRFLSSSCRSRPLMDPLASWLRELAFKSYSSWHAPLAQFASAQYLRLSFQIGRGILKFGPAQSLHGGVALCCATSHCALPCRPFCRNTAPCRCLRPSQDSQSVAEAPESARPEEKYRKSAQSDHRRNSGCKEGGCAERYR